MDHTILIRTRNRPKWVAKALQLYKIYGYTGKIYLVDDSEPSFFEQVSNLVKEYESSLNIKHEKGDGTNLSQRIDRVRESTIGALKKIDTAFYSFSSDDDFLFPEFIKQGIAFLNRNSEFETVHGPEIKVFYGSTGRILGWKPKPWMSHCFKDPVDRLLDYIHTVSIAYYGVCRTSSLRHYNEFEEAYGRRLFSRNATGFGWYDEEIPYVLYIHMVGQIGYLGNVIMGVRGIHDSPDRIENFKFGNDFNEFTIGPIVSLTKSDASIQLQRSIDDIFNIACMIGSKYDENYIRSVVYKVIWAVLSGNRSGVVDSRSDYWSHRYDSNKIKSFQKKVKRAALRKIAKWQASFSAIRRGTIRHFIRVNEDLLK